MTKMPWPRGHYLLIAIVLTLCFGASPALAASPIEGVWEFNGGKVNVHSLANGTFEGVVEEQTTFDACVHPVGQAMWTDIQPQPDGSYWGHHQWYFERSGCALNPTPGLTAWRVLTNPKGEKVLKVCFSPPESGQPTIAPDGTAANYNPLYPCEESAPVKLHESTTVSLPLKKCVVQKTLTIKLHEPKYDPLKEAVVWVKGHKVADIRGVAKLRKGIRIKKLPNGNYIIKVSAVTELGHKLLGSRKYKSCAAGLGSIDLKSGKHPSKKHHKKG